MKRRRIIATSIVVAALGAGVATFSSQVWNFMSEILNKTIALVFNRNWQAIVERGTVSVRAISGYPTRRISEFC